MRDELMKLLDDPFMGLKVSSNTNKARSAILAMFDDMKPRTIVVECSGGVVNEVHGLRDGDQWELADWDNAEDAKDKQWQESYITSIIEKAKAQ